MTAVHSAVSAADLLEAFRADPALNLVAESVRLVFQALIDAEAAERVGAERYERAETRVNERNGTRPKLITTQAGDVGLRIPKLRKGSFFPSVLERRRRVDQALYAVVMEAYVSGVSTRAVDDLVAALGGAAGISKSEVSRICQGLDAQVAAFRGRRLDGGHPYVFLDATYLDVRDPNLHLVVSRAVVTAVGVTAGGGRQILGVDVGDSEDEAFWTSFLRSLKDRGLAGVRLVVSDQHAGLVAALKTVFQGSGHQRCRVHFSRNLLCLFPKSHKQMAAAVFRTIFAQPDPEAIAAQWETVRDQLAAINPKAGPLMDAAKPEVLAFTAFPPPHWRKIWSNNPIERLNKEIKRRSRAVGIFPNDQAVIRLIGAVLADADDEWTATGRRYLSAESMASLDPQTSYAEPVAAITGSDQHNQDT